MTVRLTTERLVLRPWRLEDFEPFAAFNADEALSQYRSGALDRVDAWNLFCEYVGQLSLRGYSELAVVDRASGETAGFAGLWHPIDLDEPELAWSLYPTFHGRGFATEAAVAVQHWAHETLGLPALMSFIHPENFPSQRVAERLGAHVESEGQLGGAPRLIYRHVVPVRTHQKNQTHMTSHKETQSCH